MQTTEDLRSWFVESKICEVAPSCSKLQLQNARELREAIFLIAAAESDKRQYPAKALTTLNHWGSQPAASQRLTRAAAAVTNKPANVKPLLAMLARDAIRLFSSNPAHAVKVCAAHDCTRLFVDQSPRQDRRWCSMRRCGNRSKAKRHREQGTRQIP